MAFVPGLFSVDCQQRDQAGARRAGRARRADPNEQLQYSHEQLTRRVDRLETQLTSISQKLEQDKTDLLLAGEQRAKKSTPALTTSSKPCPSFAGKSADNDYIMWIPKFDARQNPSGIAIIQKYHSAGASSRGSIFATMAVLLSRVHRSPNRKWSKVRMCP